VTVTWQSLPIPAPTCTVSSSDSSPLAGLTTITLTASCTNSPTSYAWTNCNSTSATCQTTSANPGPQIYTVTASNGTGAGQASVTVNWQGVVPSCSVTASNPSPVVGTTITLTASCNGNPTSYQWVGCTSSTSSCSDTSAAAGSKTYAVIASNGAGAGAPAQVTVAWQASAPGPVPVCNPTPSNGTPLVGTTVTLTANCSNSPTSYSWTNCASNAPTCAATSGTEGVRSYTVTATNASGSGSGNVTVNWQSAGGGDGGGSGVVEATTGGGGSGFSALIRDSGTLWTWGDNSQSALGDGSSTSRSTPGQVSGLTGIKAATVGSSAHTLALDEGGNVFAWGANTYGEVGNGTRTPQLRPVPVPLPGRAVAVAAGDGFSLALLDNGTVYAWGRNHLGQLGNGSGADQSWPIPIGGLSGVTRIAASNAHAVALSGGTVYVWGGNFYLPPNQSGPPVPVAQLTGVIDVFAGGDNTLALKSDGTLWGFGNPADGRLGDGSASDGRTPVAVKDAATGGNLAAVQAVAAGESVSMALLGDGTLVGWGKNDRGQLGLGHMMVVTRATRLSVPVSGGVVNATAGASSFVVDARGRMFGAGSNERGGLGLGDTIETRAPMTVAGLAAITAVATTPTESLALRGDGVVLSWGSADATTALSATAAPRPVPGLSGRYVAIAGGSQTAVALRDDGTVFGWGASVPGTSVSPVVSPLALTSLNGAKAIASGGLGVIALTTANRALIACGAKPGCPGTDFGLGDVTAVAAGEAHFLVLRADKSVWAWGANDKGQLGNGDTGPAAAPVQVTGLANVRSIAAGADFSVAVREDGQAFAWGQVPGVSTFKAAPVRISGLDGATILAAASHVLALDQAARGMAWGSGSKVGERDHLVPGRAPRMDGMKALAAGVGHSLGVTSNGGVVAWGRNFQQQLAVVRTQAVASFTEVSDQANSAYTQGASPVVEFVNPAITMGGKTNLTHYFMTAYPEEVNALDTETTVKGWQRTGRNWRAWQIDGAGAASPGTPAAAKPVYRFFSSRWNSHFYTADAAEKDALLAKNPTQNDALDWKLESTAFYAVTPTSTCPALSVLPRSPYLCPNNQPPATLDCPAGYYPIYRAYSIGPQSTRPDPNHRFTSNWIDVYRNVRFAGYVYEGVAFCSPVATQPGGDLQAYHTYPGDKVEVGKPLQSEFWFANAGPGHAHQAVLVAALPAEGGNWTATCRAYNGAACPTDLSIAALRQGVVAPLLPAGGVVHITGIGTAPAQVQALSFASSIGAPSGAPDPFSNNNAAPATETRVSDGQCGVSLSAKSLSLGAEGTSANVMIDAPAGCAWNVASDQVWASAEPSNGSGAGMLRVNAAANGEAADRLATVTVAAGTTTAPLALRQPGVPPAPPCPSIKLGRMSDQIGSNTLPNRVNVVAPSNCAWQARALEPWLTITAQSAVGTGQLEYAVQPNADSSSERTGTIIVTAATKTLHVFTVTQAAGASAADQGGTGGGNDSGGPGGDSGDGGGDGAGE